MRTTRSLERTMRAAGLAAGVGVVAFALIGWRVPESRPELGAEAAFSAAPTGELEVAPVGLFLHAKGLLPGAAAQEARLAVRNQTGKPLAVSLRALPSSRDLDPLLAVRLTARGTTIFSGTLGGLRGWSRPVLLRSGGRAPISFRVSIPSSVRSGFAARIVSVPLELRSTVSR